MKYTISGINHITFAVEDLDKSIWFYQTVFGGEILAKGEKLAYFSISGIWIALNVEEKIPAPDRDRTYTHIAFTMSEADQIEFTKHLNHHQIDYTLGRSRNLKEGQSVYVRDYDGHLFEFHNKNEEDRLAYYLEERPDIKVF